MGTKHAGVFVLLYVGDGGSPEVFTRVAAQRVGGLTLGNASIDVTDKDDSRWRKLLAAAGSREVALTCQGWVNDAAAFAFLCNIATQGLIRNWMIEFANGVSIRGPFMLNSTELSGEYTAAQQFTLNLTSAGDLSVSGLGFDTVQFSASAYTAEDGSVEVTVTRTPEGNLNAATVHYATADGSAEAGVNYPETSGTLSWGAGDTSSRTFTISGLLGDVDDIAFMVHLSDASGTVIGSPEIATVTIPSIAVQLTGLSWSLPCGEEANPTACFCPEDVSNSLVLEGVPGASYEVTFRVRGVVELSAYSGGVQLSPSYFYRGQTSHLLPTFNIYRLSISSPAADYYINNGTSSSSELTAIDYEMTISIDSGATIELVAESIDGEEIKNLTTLSVVDDDPTRPVVVVQPYDGQFAQIDVVSIVEI